MARSSGGLRGGDSGGGAHGEVAEGSGLGVRGARRLGKDSRAEHRVR